MTTIEALPPSPTRLDAPDRPAERAPFPGTPAIVDGSEAVAHVETRLSEGCCAYPITPSTTMAALYQSACADGRTDLWGTPLRFLELESEHSSASAAEGFALAGGRVVNFTSGQGLVLTNHHCSRENTGGVLRPGENFDSTGFSAATEADERRVPGLFV